MDHRAEPLHGGRVTPGVVRIGDTVRRPSSGDFAHRLLRHLERVGFDAAPRLHGVDAEGRELLSFLPGAVPTDLGHYSDPQLAAAAALLRRFHDASVGVADAGAVACHNDWGPANTVFADGVPAAMIDFDTAAPGTRLWDLGYSAFVWLDLGNDDYAGAEQVRRLQVFADGYGHEGCGAAAIAVHALARQAALAASARARGLGDVAAWAAAAADWTALNLLEPLLPAGYPPPR